MNSPSWSFIDPPFNSWWKLVVLYIYLSIFISLNSFFSFFFFFFESNNWSANILFLKVSSFLVTSTCKLCWNLNSLNSLVISNNLILIEDLVRLSYWSYFLELTVLTSYCCKHFLGSICLLIRSNCSVWSV